MLLELVHVRSRHHMDTICCTRAVIIQLPAASEGIAGLSKCDLSSFTVIEDGFRKGIILSAAATNIHVKAIRERGRFTSH